MLPYQPSQHCGSPLNTSLCSLIDCIMLPTPFNILSNTLLSYIVDIPQYSNIDDVIYRYQDSSLYPQSNPVSHYLPNSIYMYKNQT